MLLQTINLDASSSSFSSPKKLEIGKTTEIGKILFQMLRNTENRAKVSDINTKKKRRIKQQITSFIRLSKTKYGNKPFNKYLFKNPNINGFILNIKNKISLKPVDRKINQLLVICANFCFGELYNKQYINKALIPFIFAIRKNHVLYNINILCMQLREVFNGTSQNTKLTSNKGGHINKELQKLYHKQITKM